MYYIHVYTNTKLVKLLTIKSIAKLNLLRIDIYLPNRNWNDGCILSDCCLENFTAKWTASQNIWLISTPYIYLLLYHHLTSCWRKSWFKEGNDKQSFQIIYGVDLIAEVTFADVLCILVVKQSISFNNY